MASPIQYSEVQMSFPDFATAEHIAITMTEHKFAAVAHILPECNVKVRLEFDAPPEVPQVLVLLKTETAMVPRIIEFLATAVTEGDKVPVTETRIKSGSPSFLQWISDCLVYEESESSQSS